MRMTPADWLDERTGYRRLVGRALYEPLPNGINWWFTLGSVLLLLLVVQFVTGAALVMYYVPAPAYAWESVRYITAHVTFGRVLRGLHVFGASFIVVAALAHLVRVVVFGAYKKPRELTWWSGLALLLVVLAFALTGYLLPWDQRAYWATVVTINIAKSAPVAGPWVADLLRGGTHLGALTLSRWFAIHVVALPAAASALVVAHLFLMRRHGIAGPPRRRPGAARAFYPDHAFRDAAAGGLVFAALLACAVFGRPPLAAMADPSDATYVPRPEWYFLGLFQLLKYFPGRLEPVGAHLLPAAVLLALVLLPWLDRSESRDPRRRRIVIGGTLSLVASVVALTALGVRNLPADAAGAWGTRALAGRAVVNGDRCARCHARGVGSDLSRGRMTRDVSWIESHVSDPDVIAPGIRPAPADGLKPLEARAVIAYVTSTRSGEPPPPVSADQERAAAVIGTRCITCHTIDGDGGRLGPDLSHVGSRHDAGWLEKWIADPEALKPEAEMPAFGRQLPPGDIAAVARFLASRR